MTSKTDQDRLWSRSEAFEAISIRSRFLDERRLKRLKYVETTIKPLVEMAHKLTDLKLTIHEITDCISTQTTSYTSWIFNMYALNRFSVGVESDLKWIKQRGNHHYASSFLSYVLRAFTSDRFSYFLLFEGRFLDSYKDEIWDGDMLPSELTQDAFTVAVAAALHLLASAVQYLRGNINRGGSKTYSSGCLDFRDSFVTLLLFHGAYVWIKFRQPPTGKRRAIRRDDRSKVYARASKNGSPTKYEARYNIPTDRLDEDHPVKCDRLSLGLYKSDVEALFVSRVARTYYEVHHGEACCVELQGVQHKFSVPRMSEHEQELVGEEKRQWVISKAKQVGKQKYAEFRKEQLAMATDTRSSDPSHSPSPQTCQPSVIRAHSVDEPLDAPSHPEFVNPGLEYQSFEDSIGFEQPWPWESPPVASMLTENEDVEAMWAVLDLYPAHQQDSTPDRNMPYSDSAQYSITESVPQEAVLSQEQYTWDAEVPQVPEAQHSHTPLQQIEVKENESVHQRYEGLLKDYERLREEIELLKSVIVTLVAGKRK